MLGHGRAAAFGELASKVFDVVRQLFNTSSVLRVDIVFDRYDTEHSIKEMERQQRQNVSSYEVQIYSSSVPVQKLWDKFMSSNTRKKPNWPNVSANTGVVNMLPVFHLEKCFF